MKTMQIDADSLQERESNRALIRAAGVKRIHGGWYTVKYNGVHLDCSTVMNAKRNPKGQIK